MNNELYNRLKEEIVNGLRQFDLSIDTQRIDAQKYIRNSLVENLFKHPVVNEYIAVILAFYESTKNEAFDFLKETYQMEFSKFYNSIDGIQRRFNIIMENEAILNGIFELCGDNVVSMIYEYGSKQENLSEKAKQTLHKIKKVCHERNLIPPESSIEKKYEPSSYYDSEKKRLEEEKEKLLKKENDLLKQEQAKKEELFSNAADVIGVDKESFQKKASKESDVNVDKIVVTPQLADKLYSNSAIVSTIPKNLFGKMLSKINQKRILMSMDFSNYELGGEKYLRITKKDTFFDKIVSCDNEVMRFIAKSAKIKKKIKNSLVKVDEKVKIFVKNAIITTNDKIKSVKTAIKTSIEDLVNENEEDNIDLNEQFYQRVDSVMKNLKEPSKTSDENSQRNKTVYGQMTEDEYKKMCEKIDEILNNSPKIK